MRIKITDLLLVVASGFITALTFPKINLLFFSWISLIPLLFVLAKKKPGQAFLLGLLGGSAFYATLLYWIPSVPAHYGNLSIPLSILIYAIFVLVLALFWAVFGFLFAFINRTYPKFIFILAPFLWVCTEYIVTHLFTGFPWGLLGYGQIKNLYFIQMASVTGVYGLSFVIVLFQSSFVFSMKSRTKSPFFAALALVLLIHVAGFVSMNPTTMDSDSFSASVIQGNVSSDIIWNELSSQEIEDIFDRHLELSHEAYLTGSRFIVWPEFSVPLCFSCPYGIYQEFKDRLFRFVSETGCTLLLGTNEKKESAGETRYYNTALVLKPDLTFKHYFKIHLVPFGEYTPYRKIFSFISSVTHAIGDVTPGKEQKLLDYEGVQFGTPICFEIIFPDLVRKFAKNGANFLVTITNDGWYGRSAAPYQHFAIAAMRAVENHRYLLRSATTGISGIIDPYGRILHTSELMTQTFLTDMIRPQTKTTFYTQYGDVLPYASLTLTVIFLILAVVKRTNDRR
ncbi:apolipoprotein N-acyltransferase [Acidobacteriota bacterium]